MFIGAHDATGPSWSKQYRSVVFAHNARQADISRAALAKVAEEKNRPTTTAIESEFKFWLAEDYHQKYQLRRYQQIDAELQAIYPNLKDYVNSTATMRLNAWFANWGSPEQLGISIDELGLTKDTQRSLAKTLRLE